MKDCEKKKIRVSMTYTTFYCVFLAGVFGLVAFAFLRGGDSGEGYWYSPYIALGALVVAAVFIFLTEPHISPRPLIKTGLRSVN